MQMQEKWQKLVLGTGIYLVLKPIMNFVLLHGSIMPLAFGIAVLAALWYGVKGSNLVAAILLMLVACANLPNNLRNFGFNAYLFYTLEGVADMLCAVLLAFHPEIRRHCKLSA